MDLFGGEQIPGFSLCQKLREKGAFFFQGHQPPAPSAAALTVEAGRAELVVFAEPLPHRLRGNRH